MLLIRGGTLVDDAGERRGDLLVDGERIAAVGPSLDEPGAELIDASGLILTAYHVVTGTDTVRVHFFDGTTTTGQVTQKQPERDLAVVQVQSLPKGVDPATLGGGIEPGEDVLAFGAPLGFYGTVTRGVISGTDRSFKVEETGQQLNGLIQFDAAANPGNSGGPLVTMEGEVVGIVTAILNPSRQRVFIGIGFAVPIENAAAAAGLSPF